MVTFDKGFIVNPIGNLPLRSLPSIFFTSAMQYVKRFGLHYIVIPVISFKYLLNPASLAGLYLGTKKSVEVRFKDGKSFLLKRHGFKSDLWILIKIAKNQTQLFPSHDLDSVLLVYGGKNVTITGPGALGLCYQLFFNNEYGLIDPKGVEVVDVGANIGDTTVFFVLSGATRVLAYEPYRFSYEFAKKNVAKNRLSGKVELYRVAVGAKKGHILVETTTDSTVSKQTVEARHGEKILIVSLSDIVRKLKGDKALLKLDCEGAEYDIILGAPDETLKKFGKIVMEYHYGYVNIKERLESAGFKVRLFGRARYYYDRTWKKPHVRIGMLMAERKSCP